MILDPSRVATHTLEGTFGEGPAVAVDLELQGRPTAEELAARLSELDGVHQVAARDLAEVGD